MKHQNNGSYTISEKLLYGLASGMVALNVERKTARIFAPPEVGTLTDNEWLALLHVASEWRQELKELGFTVESG